MAVTTYDDTERAYKDDKVSAKEYRELRTKWFTDRGLSERAVASDSMMIYAEKLEAALAEKDKEIERLKHELDFFVKCTMPDLENRISELMAQAVRFAEWASHYSDDAYDITQAFLSTPEAKAYQAQQKEGR